ncbi:MAG: antitoxin ParD1/3/4 [Rickettsiales bacterium]|jgi:antitoxin ParD1/3/4
MHINLSKEFVGFIDQNVESGFYTNAAEVVREALRRMKDGQLQEKYLRKELQIGLDQIKAGQTTQYDMEEIKKEAQEKINTTLRTQKKPNVKSNKPLL